MNNKANCHLKRDIVFILNIHIHFQEPEVIKYFQYFSSFFHRLRNEQAIENATSRRRPVINKLIFASPSTFLFSSFCPSSSCFVRYLYHCCLGLRTLGSRHKPEVNGLLRWIPELNQLINCLFRHKRVSLSLKHLTRKYI